MVERTRSRPIPSGQVSVRAAAVFLVLQALIGLAVLLQFNRFADRHRHRLARDRRDLSVHEAVHLLAADRLGLAFSWGALMGWAAAFGRLDPPAYLLYAGAIAWVIGYDTIYAHQDREDDALIGIKSTAILFGEHTKPLLAVFYALAVVLIALAGWSAGAGLVLRARACSLRRASRLADRAPRHRRSAELPRGVQVQPRRRADPVRRPRARRGAASL